MAVTARPVRSDQLLDMVEVAALMGVKPNTLRAMRAQPGRHRRIDAMPTPIRHVGNAPVWDRGEVVRWLAK